MKKQFLFRLILFFLLLAVFPAFLPAHSVAAKVTELKSTSLKNVTEAPVVSGKWEKTASGAKFISKDGSDLSFQWINYKGKIYYLGENSLRVKGWVTGNVQIDGTWYYFKPNGVYDPSVKPFAIDPSKKMVALTFDDGPGPYTERLLDCLEKNHAHATFFMVGTNVSGRASTVKRMVSLNCELGNHSWSHPSLTSLSASGVSDQISRTNAAIKNACGQNPTVCRLPYGNGHNVSYVLNAIGLPSIYWSIDTRDWANIGNPQHTINEVLNHVQSGDIILMHDIHASSVTAAETIIPALISRGYQLVTVSELAQYKGKTVLTKGRTYYSFR